MVTEGRLCRFLAITLVIGFIFVLGITIGTTGFADYGKREKLTLAYAGDLNASGVYQLGNGITVNGKPKIDLLDDHEFKDVEQNYKLENIEKVAQEYNVEKEYLFHIIEVEKMFQLKPYELLALIALESGFIPQTKMDGGSYSYNTTQMKYDTAKTAYMAITEYYQRDIPIPTHNLLMEDKYYAVLLAGGYLKYLHDTYQDKYESYTAYHRGIGGRQEFFAQNGHYKSAYALKVTNLCKSFAEGKTRVMDD